MNLMLQALDEQDAAAPSAAPSSTGNMMLDLLNEPELPAAVDAAIPPPIFSPVGAVPPVDPALSGRNDPRTAPQPQMPPPPMLDDDPDPTIDDIIASNQAIRDSITPLIQPNLRGRNDAAARSAATPPVQLGQDGVNPVSAFNPAPLTNDQIIANEQQRVTDVMGQLGPTREKANLNLNPTVSGVSGMPDNYTMDIMGSPTPIDNETAAAQIARGNTYELPNNAFVRGLSRANQSMSLLGSSLGLQDQSQAIRVMTELNRITPDQPPELQAALREIVDADGWADSLKAIANNPSAVMSVVAESLPMSAASLSMFIAGSVVGTPILGAAAGGAITYGQIYNDVIIQELREAGVDMNDNNAVQEMLSNPEFYDRARKRGETYALPIAVFDALSMGLAGKITGAFIKAGAKTPAIAGAAGLDLAVQGGLGASGEAAAQLRELQEGFRDKISRGEIALEGIAEIPLGGIEVATGTLSGSREAAANRAEAEAQSLERSVTDQVARDLLSPDRAQLTAQPEAPSTGNLMIDALEQAEPEPAPVQAQAAEPVVEQPVVEQPVVEPVAAETAPAAEPVNPQAQPVIPFARPVADTDGQQKTLTIRTPNSEQEVAVKPFIIDLADLKKAEGDFQPRDRSLKESDVAVRERASKLDPGQLIESPITSMGAPIIARDGTIISGNGRVLSIELAKAEYPEQYANYRQAIESYGTSDANYETPVLVMMLDQDMSAQDLASFADLSNRESIASMSATERAQRDAQAMDIEMVNMFRGGSLTSTENQGFVQQFMRSVVAPTEQNTMSRDGRLTKEGVQRMQNAILATAYEDTDALAIMLDSTDDNIKAISNAMLDAAPSFAKLKSDISAGEVNSQFDISANVTEAARIISDLRNRGVKPRDFFAQQDAFTQTDPNTEALIRAFYNEELTRAKSQRIMSDVLKFYTEEAAQKKQGGFFEDTTTPRDVVELARRKADGTEGQGDLLADAQQRPSRSLNESGQQARRATPTRSSKRTTGGLADTGQQEVQRRINELERTSRTEVAGEDVVGSPEDTIRPISDLDNTRQQKPGTRVDKESMRKGSALQRQAFADAGLDPDIAISFPIERQFRILSDMMQRRFGFANVVKTDNASAKEAVDQLLVGYHNLTDLAANLGLPTKAFGLEGTLSFILAKNIGAYGVYDPNTRSITLPKRSNSFAHEWFHALDHYLLGKFGDAEATKIPLASAAVKKHGSEAFGPDAPTSLKDSYFALMRAIYKDKATEAAQLQAINEKMTAMEVRAQKSGKDVSQMSTYQKLKQQKENILSAVGKSKKVKATEYRENAEFFAEIGNSSAAYWASPAEMSARAFEHFAITQLANAGLRTEGMGKSREAYDMTLEQLGITREQLENPKNVADLLAIMDSRLALTFPKGQERVEIMGAFRNLMDAIARETALGEGQAATEVGDQFVIDIRKMHDVPENVSQGFIADQKREARAARKFAEKKANQPKLYSQYIGKKKAIIGEKGYVVPMRAYAFIEDSFLAPFFYQKQGQIKAIMKRYPNNRRLKALYGKLATQTGGEFQSVFEGDTLFNAQARQVRMFSDRLKNIINANDVSLFNELETKQLHMILTSQDTLGSAPDNVVKAAGGFRTIYNNIHDYANKAGLDIGYAKSGYVPRIPDTLRIAENPKEFTTKATEVYRVVFDETLGPIDQNSLDYMLDTIKFIQDQKLRTEQVRDDGSIRTLATEPAYIEFTRGSGWQEVRELMADLRALNKQKEADPDSVTDQQIEALEADIQDAVDAVADEFAEFHAEMRESYSDMSAVNWLAAIRRGNVGDPTMSSPQAKFSKTRQLPPEADAIMEDFYVNDPVEAVTNYILAVTRKAEFERRFGLNTLPDIADKRKYNDAIEYDLTKLQEEGVSASEVNELKQTIDTMLGRNMSGFQAGMAQKLANRFAATLSITLLVRAPIASIAEPFTTALSTGSVQKGIQSFGSTMMEFPGLRKLSKNATEDIRLRHQFARILGVIDDPEVGDIMTSRIGGEFAGDPNINRLQSKFFAKIKLSGITNAQRRSASKIGFQYMLEMAYEIRNPSSERNAARAKLVLKDLGVADSRMEQFIDYILGFGEEQATMLGKKKIKTSALPQAEDVMDAQGDYTDMGLQLAVSTMRFVDQTIQDPRTVDRPRWAESGVGRIIYGITSFIYSFQDKVLKAMVRRTKREYGISRSLGKGKAASTKDAAMFATSAAAIPMLSLFTAHAIVSTAREYIFNQDRWDREWEEADEDAAKFVGKYLIPLAFARAGLTGAFDPIVQAFTGLKYQRDIANSMLGIGSYVAQNVGDIAQAFTSQNSDNTVSSEFKAFRGAYNLIIQPMISIVLAGLPLSPAAAIPATGAAMGLTSTTFKNEVINQVLELLYGQRYEPGQRGRKKKNFDL
jgi:hypothetical protein